MVKDLANSQRYYAWLQVSAPHGVGFATAGLSIGKDCAVEATNNLLYQGLCGLFIYLLSRPALATDVIKHVRSLVHRLSSGMIDLIDLAVLVPPCRSFFCF